MNNIKNIRKNKLYLVCVFGLLIELWFFAQISYGGHLSKDNILGDWQSLHDECKNSLTLNITDSCIFSVSSYFLIKYSYIISDTSALDGSILLKLFNAKYSPDNGSNYFELGSETDTIKANVFLENDILILLVWKGGDRFGEFQIAVAYNRKNESGSFVFQPTINSIFYLPKDYIGYVWVAKDQLDGNPAEQDIQGRRVFYIPESGLLLTQSKPMPTALAKREFAFYYITNEGIDREEISVLSHDCFSYFKEQEFSVDQIKEYGFDYDQIYVYYYRYNNPGREEINKFFEKDINGQVFWFRVDTLENLLKNEPMLPRFRKM